MTIDLPSTSDVFDSSFPVGERFPRLFEITFSAANNVGQKRVALLYEDRVIGDPLTDNAIEDDGYRFHDAFHLAYCARLGWSPVVRKFFGCKRKSRPELHDLEDSGRATATEEAVCALIHSFAVKENFFQDSPAIDRTILRLVSQMVERLEVSVRTHADWEDSIRQGYSAWLSLRKYQGGTVRANLLRGELQYVAP